MSKIPSHRFSVSAIFKAIDLWTPFVSKTAIELLARDLAKTTIHSYETVLTELKYRELFDHPRGGEQVRAEMDLCAALAVSWPNRTVEHQLRGADA